jgi:hypothetical protein
MAMKMKIISKTKLCCLVLIFSITSFVRIEELTVCLQCRTNPKASIIRFVSKAGSSKFSSFSSRISLTRHNLKFDAINACMRAEPDNWGALSADQWTSEAWPMLTLFGKLSLITMHAQLIINAFRIQGLHPTVLLTEVRISDLQDLPYHGLHRLDPSMTRSFTRSTTVSTVQFDTICTTYCWLTTDWPLTDRRFSVSRKIISVWQTPNARVYRKKLKKRKRVYAMH